MNDYQTSKEILNINKYIFRHYLNIKETESINNLHTNETLQELACFKQTPKSNQPNTVIRPIRTSTEPRTRPRTTSVMHAPLRLLQFPGESLPNITLQDFSAFS